MSLFSNALTRCDQCRLARWLSATMSVSASREFGQAGLGNEAARGLGVRSDRGERLPDLMSERPRQRGEGRDPADMGEFLPQVTGLLFGAFPSVTSRTMVRTVVMQRTARDFVVAGLAGDRHEYSSVPGSSVRATRSNRR